MTKHYASLVAETPDLTGKVFAITGTTTGFGYIVAETVASKGANVLLLNRPSERSKVSLAKLQAAVPSASFIAVDCDLQDFDSVKKVAQTIKEDHAISELYCLASNAGIMALPNQATKDGYDVQMQTNHLSHFLLTQQLFPLLKAGAEKHGEARIVNHSSAARNMVPGKFLQEQYLGKNGPHLGDDKANIALFNGGCFIRYHHSKLANTVFTHALKQKLDASSSPAVKSIKSIACHPGVSGTALADHLQGGCFMKMMNPILKILSNSIDDGAMGLLYGMVSPDAESGLLYGPKNDGFSGPAVRTELKEHETDQTACDMLWKKSEEATGVTFDDF